jgi:exosortase D (VPLPA-CTERM-specific)
VASTQSTADARQWRREWPGSLALALTALALTALWTLFGESLAIVVKSFQKPEFSHGYIVPLISGWILWQRRQLIAARAGRGAWSGWLLVAAGAAAALVCHAANLLTPPYVAFLTVLVGLAAARLGWAAARLVLVPIGFLLFAYPLPSYLYVELSTALQLVSSKIGAGLLDMVGVPVFLDGNIIDLGSMRLQVAEACSGLRYLLPLLTFGLLCAFMYRAPRWAKLLVIAATVPLTIVLNGLRIALTGLFMHLGSPGLAEGFMHLFEGWVVFLLALALLFGLMYGLLRLLGWRGPFVDMLDFDRMAGTPGGQVAVAATAAPSLSVTTPPRPLVAAVATLALAALLLVPLGARPQLIPERPGLLSYPAQLGEWRGVPRFLDATTEGTLGADDYVLLDFTAGGTTPPVNLWVAYYDSLLQGSHIHSPTTCLPGSGWEYVEFGTRRTPVTALSGAPLVVNRGLITKGEQQIVMYFWMELRGRSLHAFSKVKFVNLWDSLIAGRSDGALVRLHTPVRPGETPAAADARLQDFLARAYPHLAPHVGA